MDAITDIISFLVKAPFICCGWIIIGAAAGALARRFMGSKDKPLINDLILGLMGAIIGGFITSIFSIDTNSNGLMQIIVTLIVATGGAMVLIFAGRALTGRR